MASTIAEPAPVIWVKLRSSSSFGLINIVLKYKLRKDINHSHAGNWQLYHCQEMTWTYFQVNQNGFSLLERTIHMLCPEFAVEVTAVNPCN